MALIVICDFQGNQIARIVFFWQKQNDCELNDVLKHLKAFQSDYLCRSFRLTNSIHLKWFTEYAYFVVCRNKSLLDTMALDEWQINYILNNFIFLRVHHCRFSLFSFQSLFLFVKFSLFDKTTETRDTVSNMG